MSYEYEMLRYHSIMTIEKVFSGMGMNVIIDGLYLKIQIIKEDTLETIDVGELEIGYDKELMTVKIKTFLVEDNPETAIEIGEVRTLRNYNDGKIYSTVIFYDFTNN